MIKKIWKRAKLWSIPVGLTLLCYVMMQYVFLIGYVPSASMEPTLQSNSMIFGLRIFGELNAGDIVVFEKDDTLQVKRIVAGPGEKIDLSKLEYMDSLPAPKWRYSVLTVPAGHFFVLGDNTQNSYDSRYWENPFVAENQIVAILSQK